MNIKFLSILMTIAVLFSVDVRANQVTPDEFLNVLNQAQERSRASDWAAAVPLWERVVTINPKVGGFWYSLGTAQRNAGDYRKAIPTLEKALELGGGRRSPKQRLHLSVTMQNSKHSLGTSTRLACLAPTVGETISRCSRQRSSECTIVRFE